MFTKFMFVIGLIAMISVPSIVSAQDPDPPHGGGYAAPPPAAAPIQDPGASPALMHKGFIEGSLGIGVCNGDDCSDDVSSLDPGVGINISGFIFVNPNIAIGANFNYQLMDANINVDYVDSVDFSTTYFGVEARLYNDLSPGTKIFGLIGLGIISLDVEIKMDGYDTYDGSEDGKSFKIGGGIDFMMGPKMSLGGIAYYQFNSWDYENGDGDDPSLNYLYVGVKISYFF
jgi:opacity protein-like surface antigen